MSGLRKYLPVPIWGGNFVGVRWFGLQLGWFTDWADDDVEIEPYREP